MRGFVALRSRLRNRTQNGATMLEFVLSVMVVMFVLFWIVEFSLALYAYNVLADAAKEGVRYAIVHGTTCVSDAGGTPPSGCTCYGPGGGGLTCDSSAAGVYSKVREYGAFSLQDISGLASGCSGGGGCIDVQYPDSSSKPGSRVYVVVHYPYLPWFNIGWSGTMLKVGAEGRIVY